MTVTLGPTIEASAVEVPLIRGDGEPRPKVLATIDEAHELVAVLDLAHRPPAIGGILAARLGIDVRGERARVRKLRVGDLLLDDVELVVVPGEELTIGVGALPDLATAVLPSAGVVRFVRAADADALLDAVGPALPLDPLPRRRWREHGLTARAEGPAFAVAAALDGREGLLHLRSDRARSTLGFALPEEQAPAGVPEVWTVAQVHGLLLPGGWWAVDGSLADPRPDLLGALGADALARLDVAIDPAGGRLALAPVAYARWSDAASQRLAILEAEAERWPLPATDGEDLLARLRWERLAAARWAVGDAAGALAADASLAKVAGDRCELHLAIGERRLRSGHDPRAALGRAAELHARWLAQGAELRERARAGRALPEGALAIPQPAGCARAALLLEAIDGRLDRSEAALRARIAAGARLDPPTRLALAVALHRDGREEPARAFALRASRLPDPHPLVTALGIAEGLGPDALLAAIEADPGWVAGRVVAEALGLAVVEADRVEDLRALRPGDPSALCTVALYDGLRAPAILPDRPEADCLAAAVLLAHVRDRADAGAAAREALRARWPELWVDDPGPSVVRMHPEEDP